jgi:hypothetical protein
MLIKLLEAFYFGFGRNKFMIKTSKKSVLNNVFERNEIKFRSKFFTSKLSHTSDLHRCNRFGYRQDKYQSENDMQTG